jgi:hypothetical protein
MRVKVGINSTHVLTAYNGMEGFEKYKEYFK